jgi:hypothetical protein
MVGNEVKPDIEAGGPFRNPWPPLVTGLTTTLVALISAKMLGSDLGWVPFLLVAIGVLAAGIGVAIRPGSAAVLGLAAVTALIASGVGPKTEWDSARLVLRILAFLGGVGAVLVLCPTSVRRAVVSALILIHFGGILSAVTSPDQSWLANQAWSYFYRPYLQFMYLNNAYRFYSPEPGPATLIWFCVEYQPDPDGSRNLRWVKVPSLDKDGGHIRPDGSPLWPNLEYTRRLSLAESTQLPGATMMGSPEMLILSRDEEARRRGLPLLSQLRFPLNIQYHEPSAISKTWIAMYARHVAHTYRHQTKPDLEVIGVKVYKVLHLIITPADLARGMEADDPTLYYPYYMGEFDKDGDMKPSCLTLAWDPDRQMWDVARDTAGRYQRDGLLYWLIPIVRWSPDPTREPSLDQKPSNFVLKHAGDVEGGDLP